MSSSSDSDSSSDSEIDSNNVESIGSGEPFDDSDYDNEEDDDEHNIKMLKSTWNEMKSIWEDDELCDITLEVDGQFIKAHKVVLASHSPYFRAMFCGRFQDAQKESIELKGVYEKSLSALVL